MKSFSFFGFTINYKPFKKIQFFCLRSAEYLGVYNIPSEYGHGIVRVWSCLYVGQTIRALKLHVKEHMRWACIQEISRSSLTEHTGHAFKVSYVKSLY